MAPCRRPLGRWMVACLALALMLACRSVCVCLGRGRDPCRGGGRIRLVGEGRSRRRIRAQAAVEAGSSTARPSSCAAIAVPALGAGSLAVSGAQAALAAEVLPGGGATSGLNALGVAAAVAVPLACQVWIQSQQAEVDATQMAYSRVKDGQSVFTVLQPVAVVAGIVVALFTNVGFFMNSAAASAGYVYGFNLVGVLAGLALPALYTFSLQAQVAEVAEKEKAYEAALSQQAVAKSYLPVAVGAGALVAFITSTGVVLPL